MSDYFKALGSGVVGTAVGVISIPLLSFLLSFLRLQLAIVAVPTAVVVLTILSTYLATREFGVSGDLQIATVLGATLVSGLWFLSPSALAPLSSFSPQFLDSITGAIGSLENTAKILMALMFLMLAISFVKVGRMVGGEGPIIGAIIGAMITGSVLTQYYNIDVLTGTAESGPNPLFLLIVPGVGLLVVSSFIIYRRLK
jgi:hypothetical protein